jgi:hypothetical protein
MNRFGNAGFNLQVFFFDLKIINYDYQDMWLK